MLFDLTGYNVAQISIQGRSDHQGRPVVERAR